MNVIGRILAASIVRGRDADVLTVRVRLEAGAYDPLRETHTYKGECIALEIIDDPFPEGEESEAAQELDPVSPDGDADDDGRYRDDAESVEE